MTSMFATALQLLVFCLSCSLERQNEGWSVPRKAELLSIELSPNVSSPMNFVLSASQFTLTLFTRPVMIPYGLGLPFINKTDTFHYKCLHFFLVLGQSDFCDVTDFDKATCLFLWIQQIMFLPPSCVIISLPLLAALHRLTQRAKRNMETWAGMPRSIRITMTDVLLRANEPQWNRRPKCWGMISFSGTCSYGLCETRFSWKFRKRYEISLVIYHTCLCFKTWILQ